MKTPNQGDSTLGIMMSGESPTPTPHGDRHYDLKDSLLGPSLNTSLNGTKSMVDQGIQSEPEELDKGSSSQYFSQTFVLKDLNPSLNPTAAKAASASTSEKTQLADTQFERIDKADEILPSPSQLDVKATVSTKPEEEIQIMVDQTDGRLPAETYPKTEQEDDCLVDCLYYVDQCCHCRIL